jgi:hypothetical protein
MADDDLELPGGLGRRIGPLPLGAWIGAGVAGVALAFVWNRRRKSAAGGGGTDEAAADLEAADAAAAPFVPTSFVVGGGATATGSSGGASPTGDGTPTETPPTGYGSNAAWKSAALSALIGKGYPATVADDALARYLESQSLTSQQSALVGTALQLVGPAPDPVPAAPSPPPDPSLPTSAPSSPAPAAAWTRPAWLGNAKFVKGDGPAVYLVTANGLEWVPSESAFYALGGGGTIRLADGSTYTYAQNGTPPVVVSDAALATLPVVGARPN